MGELWLNGGMEERECGWLERQMVSRHPLGLHNSMQGRNDLRVTPIVIIYPHYRFKNGSLVPIGNKGRFLPFENSKKMNEM